MTASGEVHDPPPELSYLALVERNNELLARLVAALDGWDVPEAYRPLTSGWRWRVELPQGQIRGDGLVLEIECNPNGLTLHLATFSGNRLHSTIMPFTGRPLPG
jgi:hypothetical protein